MDRQMIRANRKARGLLLVVAMASGAPVSAQDFKPVAVLTGIAAIKDGDGLLFGQVEIRLQGIAAPELGTAAGAQSTANLRRLSDGRQVTCYLDGTRAGRALRPVALCTVDGQDLGELQVLAGMALDCRYFSRGRYEAAERRAVAQGNDLQARYARPDYCR